MADGLYWERLYKREALVKSVNAWALAELARIAADECAVDGNALIFNTGQNKLVLRIDYDETERVNNV